MYVLNEILMYLKTSESKTQGKTKNQEDSGFTKLIIFLEFRAKLLRIVHPVNCSYLPP